MRSPISRTTFTVLLALAGSALLSPAAHANVPPPVTKTNTIRVPSLGNSADGTLTTKLTYSGTTATASASTGNTVGLGKGYLFKLTTCVAYHLYASAPVSSCADRLVDTSAAGATVSAPSITLSNQPRPSGAVVWGYFTAYTQVTYQSAGSWPLVAHSWPDAGLQAAGLAVAAQNATTATLPPNQPVAVDGAYNGQINSGQTDSLCFDAPMAPDGSPLPAGVSTSHLAFAGAPAYYEVGLPTASFAGQAPRGVMLVVHGGGWSINGVGAVQASRGEADRWRARGFETVTLTYRGCAQAFNDTAWFYDHARTWFGATAKICATGASAGGHLALMLAARRPDVYCVVSEAGPTDLQTIQTQQAYDTTTGTLAQTNGGRWVHNLGAAAFGAENLQAFSPATAATLSLKSTRVLQGISATDAIIPWAQATELRDAMLTADLTAYVDSDQLATGTLAFVHGYASQAALDDFYAREVLLVAPITSPTVALEKR